MKLFIPTLLLAAFFSVTTNVGAQSKKNNNKQSVPTALYRYRVCLTDKDNNSFSIKKPQAFLSAKALERRNRYGIAVDEIDLPLPPSYLKKIKQEGLKIYNQSKWTNSLVVETDDTMKVVALKALPFVKSIRKVWIGTNEPKKTNAKERFKGLTYRQDTLSSFYGQGQAQAEMLNAQRLHEAGYRGQGMTIAVIDGGFLNADTIKGLKGVKVLGTRNFVDSKRSVFEEESHGMMVLSCIAAHTPYSFVGTCPEASFYLLQSEDSDTEQLVEEDNFCSALEYADSLGCDVVTASLGYYRFDYPEMNPTYADLDGKTSINSIAASVAASRGMLFLNSAGNEGDNTWKKIGFPGDAKDILTVGAVRADSVNTLFSSLGYTADRRIKPDVMAMGQASTVYQPNGLTGKANGTSFSTPILCGAVTCLWQAHRDKTPIEIIKAVQRAGNNYATPNEVFGYGIPDLWKAHQILGQ